MAKLGICAAFLLAVFDVWCTADVRAADVTPTKAPSGTTASATPASCSDPTDFFTTNCQLTWYGITLYGTIDAGVTWRSHGAPFNGTSAVGVDYLIRKYSNRPRWDLAITFARKLWGTPRGSSAFGAAR